ncbi:putative nucleoside-diphosphate-sugar epimerase protein [Eutypa lata UCREL1]|uniref:Putative nucleoside-diphosphate-sugar epimerase protein n=1 Tax=Eutypa lata (strain UCR-EL1) TaxID=1287681 RepID=M7THW5_EUTLA|nr:putative nucleoside-diphosphate-sugar epimerase protein [Eutypa lata UCREL1]
MKLIITGASGLCGQELVRQSLSRKEITSVVAVARRPIVAPDNLPAGADASKLRSVVVKDYFATTAEYPEDTKNTETVAILPTQLSSYTKEEIRRVCLESAVAGIEIMCQAGPAKPFRFLYMSGAGAERNQSKRPKVMPEYSLLRVSYHSIHSDLIEIEIAFHLKTYDKTGLTNVQKKILQGEAETEVLAYAAKHDRVEAAAARPGMIFGQDQMPRRIFGAVIGMLTWMWNIDNDALCRIMLGQVINGFEKDPLSDQDLARMAKRIV